MPETLTHQSRPTLALPLIEAIRPEHRISNGNLTPEARELLIEQVQRYIGAKGIVSANEVKKKLGIRHWDTARQLLKEAVDRIISETENFQAWQLLYYKMLTEQVRGDWAQFGIKNRKEEEEVISVYYEKINAILRMRSVLDHPAM